MRIIDLFSKRQQRLRGEVPDIFVYDKIPPELRVQVVYILTDYLGNARDATHSGFMVYRAYEFIVTTLCREYGLFYLPGTKEYGERNYVAELTNFILTEKSVERVMDAVELSCRVMVSTAI